ncbi:MAG: anti-phage dCTP deaminase [Terracidiphilus sp.]
MNNDLEQPRYNTEDISRYAEIVLGLVYAAGTDIEPVIDTLRDYVQHYGYKANEVRVSDYIKENLSSGADKCVDGTEIERIENLIRRGDEICAQSGKADFLALAAIAKIAELRPKDSDNNPLPWPKTVHIVRSLKRPEEVVTLRQVYRPGFFLIGVFATEEERLNFLVDRKAADSKRAKVLIETDAKEEGVSYGQHTRDTFHRSDVFIQLKGDAYKDELHRFLDLVFGQPHFTPTPDEYAMFLAAAAGARSAQFGRQVGAAIVNREGDLVAVGCNDVPRAGGGLYWFGDKNPEPCRDHEREEQVDSNDEEKKTIEEDILENVQRSVREALEQASAMVNPDQVTIIRDCLNKALPRNGSLLKGTRLSDITEFGRAVHAEMDALTSCERTGASVRGGTLYTSTFPCHNCTRHIIAAGITRVVYIEPYPKSRAVNLHGDAIRLANSGDMFDPKSHNKDEWKIPFVPFVGIGPRRFFDLFSMELSSGYVMERKANGRAIAWERSKNRGPRVPMIPASYLDREEGAVRVVSAAVMERGGTNGIT